MKLDSGVETINSDDHISKPNGPKEKKGKRRKRNSEVEAKKMLDSAIHSVDKGEKEF